MSAARTKDLEKSLTIVLLEMLTILFNGAWQRRIAGQGTGDAYREGPRAAATAAARQHVITAVTNPIERWSK
jgi:hypothetical protein